MIETDSLDLVLEKVSKLMNAEIEVKAETWQLVKKRAFEAQRNSNMCVCWSLDLSVSINSFNEKGEAINEAEVFLLPEELPIFTSALRKHPILFPTNYSQHLAMERGMYCVRLKSQECPKAFAERLAEALCALDE